jgi:homocitrate synthase NifV
MTGQREDAIASDAYLIDTTLRDGEQAPGVAFRSRQRREIAERLAAIGIGELEVGTPAMGGAERSSIQEMVRLNLPCRLTAWCRAKPEDLEHAAACGVPAVHFSLPASEIHLQALGRDLPWAIARIATLAARARQDFDFISIGAQDASRAEPDSLLALTEAARQAGADRLRLADTVGVWGPAQVAGSCRRLRSAAGAMQLGFHAHNDLGMATANSLAALQSGARSVDVTVGGLGERAGNAALEQVVMALRLVANHDAGIRTVQLAELCRCVAQAAGRAIPVDQPIVGSHVVRHESGIHVHGMLRDPRTYQPFPAEWVGRNDQTIVAGKHSGRASLEHLLAEAGVCVDRRQATALLPHVQRLAESQKRALSAAELVQLHASVFSTEPC